MDTSAPHPAKGTTPVEGAGTARPVTPADQRALPSIPQRAPGPAGHHGTVNLLVEDNPARRRFEILADDSLAGFTTYEQRPAAIVLTHTEVDPRFTDQGVGSALVRGALDQVRERGERVIVECAFVAAYIERHPEYAAMLTAH